MGYFKIFDIFIFSTLRPINHSFSWSLFFQNLQKKVEYFYTILDLPWTSINKRHFPHTDNAQSLLTVSKVFVFRVFMVCILSQYLSVFSLNAGKYRPAKLWIRTLFTPRTTTAFSFSFKIFFLLFLKQLLLPNDIPSYADGVKFLLDRLSVFSKTFRKKYIFPFFCVL